MNARPFRWIATQHLHQGFSLVELMVTITVAAILTAMGVPAFNSFVLNDRASAQINSLVMSLNYARSEAVKRDSAGGFIVCPSVDALTCSGTAWSGGWIVRDVDPADLTPVIQTVPALAGSNTLSATGAATGVTFFSSGMVAAPLTIKFCDRRGAGFAHTVEINATGRVATSQVAGQAVNGTALTCP